MMAHNPYSAGGQSKYLIDRVSVAVLSELLGSGHNDRGLVLLGGPGSGKTTALKQLEKLLENENTTVCYLDDRDPNEDACHHRVTYALGGTPNARTPNCTYVIEQWLSEHPTRHLVLLFDEFGAQLPNRGRVFFNAIERVRQGFAQRLMVLLAAGSQLMRFQMAGGSPFLSRARSHILPPLERAEIERLAAAFEDPLDVDILDAISVLSGGNAFLVTHTLQHLWSVAPNERTIERVADILDNKAELGSFKTSFEIAIESRQTKRPVRRIWDHLVSHSSPYDLDVLARLCEDSEPGLPVETVLLFLEAAGLLRQTVSGRSVVCELIPTVLRPPRLEARSEDTGTLQERLERDVTRALLEIHSNGVDYHRTEGKKDGKNRMLVPEAVFSAFICSWLRAIGWDTEREVQRVEGRIDVRARHVACPGESGIIEMKIWGRHGYKTVGEQAAGYHQPGVTAFVAVTLSDLERVDSWPDRFASECLRGPHERVSTEAPLAGRFRAAVTTADNAAVAVTHQEG